MHGSGSQNCLPVLTGIVYRFERHIPAQIRAAVHEVKDTMAGMLTDKMVLMLELHTQYSVNIATHVQMNVGVAAITLQFNCSTCS